MSNKTDLNITALSIKTIAIFYFSLALIYALSTWLWQGFAFLFNTVEKRTFKEAILDTGMIAIGKYIPGKFWGILARGAVTDGNIKFSRSTVAVSTIEQIFALVMGLFFITALMLFQYFSFNALLFCLPALTLLLAGPKLLGKFDKRWPLLSPISSVTIPRAALFIFGYLILWTLSAMPVLVLMSSIYQLDIAQMVDVSTAFISAIIAGWIAIFAPGGIGVREAAFAAAAPEWLSWQQGLSWVALHRALYTIFDVVYGALVLLILSRDIRRTPSNA